MLQHNIKLAFRNFKKDKSTFLINLIGLSTGLACAILIFMWVSDEWSVDKFHKNDEQLFRIFSNYDENGKIATEEALPPLLAKAMEEELPDVKLGASSSAPFSTNGLTSNDIYLSAKGRFVTKNFFKLFSFEILKGDKYQIFPTKSGIVISEKLAKKFYPNTENVLGKIITYESGKRTIESFVSGVFKDLPKNSTFQFDYLLPFDLYLDRLNKDIIWNNYIAETYVLLHENVALNDFNKKIEKFLTTKHESAEDILWAQKFTEGYLQGEYREGKITGGRITYVRLFSLIALFILLIACINFMNLSTANATKKFKEIGVKKTIGADRQTLIFQYLSESMMLSFFSLFIAFVLIYSFLPSFNLITGKQLSLEITASGLASVFGITLLTGFISGSYPAFYLSGFKPAKIFKGNIKNSWGELFARKGLVVFQFAVSIILIVSVVVIFKQIEFIQNKKLGFNRDNIVHFYFNESEAVSQDVFISEIKKIPSVINASSMQGGFVNDINDTNGTFNWEGKDPNFDPVIHYTYINYDMLEMMDVEMEAGRSFDRKYNNEFTKIIFNETGARLIGLKEPVGKTFNLWGDDFEIIGIVKDFHFESLKGKIKALALFMGMSSSVVSVKTTAAEMDNLIAKSEATWKSFAPTQPFRYDFLDDRFAKMYKAEDRVSKLFGIFSLLAIFIACLGLLALATFMTEQRRKEIGIRKVLGASVPNIVFTLSKSFLTYVIFGLLIATPIAWIQMGEWLNNLEYRIDLEWWMFAFAGVMAIGIAFLTVGSKSLIAAMVNPVNSLKNE